MPGILDALQREAPHAELAVEQPRGDVGSLLEAGEADVALGPAQWGRPGLLRRGLGDLRWCVVGREDHPAWRGRFTTKKWMSEPHVEVRTGTPEPSLVGAAIVAAGLERNIGLTVPSFLAALLVVSRSRFFFCAPQELVVPLAPQLGLAHRPLPLPAPTVSVAAFWSQRVALEPGTRWFREQVVAFAERMLGPPRGPARAR